MSLTVYLKEMCPTDVYRGNVTHNLTEMARAAGLYEVLWRPDELGLTHAKQLIQPLQDGLTALQADPPRYKDLEPSNGWGTYEGLVGFVTGYLTACQEHPDATLEISR